MITAPVFCHRGPQERGTDRSGHGPGRDFGAARSWHSVCRNERGARSPSGREQTISCARALPAFGCAPRPPEASRNEAKKLIPCSTVYGFLISEREMIPPSGPHCARKFKKTCHSRWLPIPRRRRSGPNVTFPTRARRCIIT
jgi:hypothetical protein